jgi:hypothetical protein
MAAGRFLLLYNRLCRNVILSPFDVWVNSGEESQIRQVLKIRDASRLLSMTQRIFRRSRHSPSVKADKGCLSS